MPAITIPLRFWAVIPSCCVYVWGDEAWMEQRRRYDWQHRPMSVYEVHLGSWRRGQEGACPNLRHR